ncbi:MAG: C25 family cysteine peptidase [bacterium]
MLKKTIFLLVMIFATVLAGNVNKTVQLTAEQLTLRREGNYDVVYLRGAFFLPEPGKPLLPYLSLTLIIPPHARVTAVTAVPITTQEIPGQFTITPARVPVPISFSVPPSSVPPDPAIYNSHEPFPPRTLVFSTTGSAAGFKLVNVVFCPFEYRPASKKLFFHSRIQVKIKYEENATAQRILTPFQRDRMMRSLYPLVANPEDLNRFAPSGKETDQPSVEYLVITSPELSQNFTPYLQYKESRGLRTELRTTDWIERNYPGRDLPEKIRNLITDYFHSRGLIYVLLAGDNRQVPSRHIEVAVGNEQGSIPTDLYYGDLDYSWDSNHNNRFGEMEDSIDLYADVFVGRASVDNWQQVENFIAKVRTFETNPAPDYIKRSLLPSGWLWRSLNYHGKFVNDSIATITPAGWIDRKLENPPGALVVADSFDHGFLIFDPAGHGNESGVYDENGTAIYTSSLAGRQQNDRRFSLITSLACHPGNFEAEDCLAEVALNCQNGGAIGVMMNSRYGWGTPPVMGPSEKLCVRFYDFLFNHNEYELGPVHNRSREEYSGAAIYDPLWRWCLTEFNLLGDPTIAIWTEPPANLNLTSPDTIHTGSQTLAVIVREGNNSAPGVKVTLWKDDVILATGVTSSKGVVNLDVHPLTAGELLVTAHRHNNLPVTKTVVVVPGEPEPILALRRWTTDDQGQPRENGILEPGETARLKIVLANLGSTPATGTSLTLRTLTQNLVILDSIAQPGTIPAGDSITIENLTISAPSSARPGSTAEMCAVVHCNQGEFTFWIAIELGYPGRTAAEIDTGTCALTVTARGTIGYDPELDRLGRGFRYPKTDTSRLNLASFCLGNSGNYLIDRFYTQNQTQLDRDWQLQESLRISIPLWNSDEFFFSSFNDRGHPLGQGLVVDQRALGFARPELAHSIVLVYDIWNTSAETISNLFAGILADFDVRPTDRLHDIASTLDLQNATLMRHVNSQYPCVGVKLLYPRDAAHLTCIDHGRYIYPDSGLTDEMKFRALTGTLGVPVSDRPYNWSIAVASGPFNLPGNNGRQRLAFAFIAADDSLSFVSSCSAIQDWYDNCVGLEEETKISPSNRTFNLSVTPNPTTDRTLISFSLPAPSAVRISIFDITGRKVATILDNQKAPAGIQKIRWEPRNLVPGVYFLHLQVANSPVVEKCLITVVRR